MVGKKWYNIMILKVIFYSIVWSLLGALFLIIVGVLDKFDDFSFVNPIKIYKTYRVNYFGAALICIIYNLLCPVGSIGYWIYKICTVGRKK